MNGLEDTPFGINCFAIVNILWVVGIKFFGQRLNIENAIEEELTPLCSWFVDLKLADLKSWVLRNPLMTFWEARIQEMKLGDHQRYQQQDDAGKNLQKSPCGAHEK